jgi:hypothetical protein
MDVAMLQELGVETIGDRLNMSSKIEEVMKSTSSK